MDNIAMKQALAVSVIGANVILQVSDVQIPMDYNTALNVSQQMRVAAKAAMKVSGVNDHWSDVNTVEELVHGMMESHAASQVPTSQASKRIVYNLDNEGELVVLTLGDVVMKFNHVDALQISDWFRIRGKEAKANAGDFSKTWRTLGTLHDATPGGA